YFAVAAQDRNNQQASLSNISSATASHFEMGPFDTFNGISAGAVAIGNLNPNTDGHLDVVTMGMGAQNPLLDIIQGQGSDSQGNEFFNETPITANALKNTTMVLTYLNRDGMVDIVAAGVDNTAQGVPHFRIRMNTNGVFVSSPTVLPAFGPGGLAVA